jgi:hypothetical protein
MPRGRTEWPERQIEGRIKLSVQVRYYHSIPSAPTEVNCTHRVLIFHINIFSKVKDYLLIL